MISELLFKGFQGWVKDKDPEQLRSWFYLVHGGIGALVIFALIWRKQRDTPSGFRVRESDLKRQMKQAIGTKPALGHLSQAENDPLAQARYAKKAAPLKLAGISIHGEPHEILGVRHDASEAEIRAAYRDRMKQYHPDRIGRPGSREWQDAQGIAEAINIAKEKMLSSIRKK
jgi:hypothetical protein